MSQVLVNESSLSGIAGAIRQKNGTNSTYKPSQMAAAIQALPGASTLGTKNIVTNGNYAASGDNLDGYSSVSVNVPNSYAAADEGKVVSNGALVAQTARASAITQNGTYDTTTNDEVTVNVSGGSSGLDDPFALADYIQSSGTQYIDTGYIVKGNSRFEMVCNIAQANSYPSPWGTRVAYRNNSCFVWFRMNYSDATTYAWSNDNGNNAENRMQWGGNTNRKIVLTASQNGIKIDVDTFYNTGGITNSYAGTPVNSYPLFIFCYNDGGHINNDSYATMKLYRFRIYEGSTLVMELLPAVDSNSVVCLQDTVSGNYFYNAGTGAFTYGTDS